MLPDNLYNEQQLIWLISQGDEHAFAKLFDHYRNKIYSVALKLTHSTSVAEEIVEDVFLKIWVRRSTLNEIENFNAYLFIIARNETYRILKQIAKNYQIVLLTENLEAVAIDNSEDILIGKECASLLQKAIQALPHQQKKVYQLIKEQELKRAEVAEILQIHPETVKFHLAQAMKNIRTFFILHINLFISFPLLFSLIMPT